MILKFLNKIFGKKAQPKSVRTPTLKISQHSTAILVEQRKGVANGTNGR